ncbi:hypothetical protein ACK4D5_10720 [Enterococcus faecium]|uniref:hypothetical protein n=1 Tax=Enterococcus faecium TaxID=1352 RepID=UPI002270B962|nr:hypothetical protein [Enterococcus faecium]HAQ5014939.1 hypothetical protein [Enterococcus faecium]HAR1439186.1 hypothetical protein [Enterococcus faecium]
MKKIDWLLHHILKILIFLTTLFLLVVYVFSKSVFNSLYCNIYTLLIEDNNNLITVATVLIGIYFSLYSYILSADLNSFFGRLKDRDELKFLIAMINLGFFSSFIFVISSLANNLLYQILKWGIVLILGILVLIMFGTLIQIGVYYVFIIRNDILTKFDKMQDDLLEEDQRKKLERDMREFLDDYNEEKVQKKLKK